MTIDQAHKEATETPQTKKYPTEGAAFRACMTETPKEELIRRGLSNNGGTGDDVVEDHYNQNPDIFSALGLRNTETPKEEWVKEWNDGYTRIVDANFNAVSVGEFSRSFIRSLLAKERNAVLDELEEILRSHGVTPPYVGATLLNRTQLIGIIRSKRV